MKLIHLGANNAWVFTSDGRNIIQLKGQARFFATTIEARQAAQRLGLIIYSDGEVGLSEEPLDWAGALTE